MITNQERIKITMPIKFSLHGKVFIKEEWIIFDTLLDCETNELVFSGEMISCFGTSAAVWSEEEDATCSGEYLLLDS